MRTVHAEDRTDVLVESGGPDRDKIDERSGEIHLKSARRGSADLVVRSPVGLDLVVGSASGDIVLKGSYREVRATGASGDVEIERAEDIDVRTVSGSISVGECAGSCRLQTVSGKTSVGASDKAELSSISGRILIAAASGEVTARSVSGTVEIGTQGRSGVAVKTVSGSVSVQLPQGTRPAAHLASLSSSPRCDCPPGDDCQITVKSMSGKIEVVAR